MQNTTYRAILIAAAFLVCFCPLGNRQLPAAIAQQTPGNKNVKTPLKITWEIYSGRVSPYFEVKSMTELHQIEARLENLPQAPGSKKTSQWPGAYMFELPDQETEGTRQVSVSQSEIQVRAGKKTCIYSDSKSLRKYLDQLKGKYKLISGDGRPVP